MSNTNTINEPTDLTVGYATGTSYLPGAYSNDFTYTVPSHINTWVDSYNYKEIWDRMMRPYKELTYEGLNKTYEELNKKEEKMADSKNKTIAIFDGKDEAQKLLEEYGIVNELGLVTDTGLQVLLKLVLADKKEDVVTKLKADKDSKKKKTTE